MGAIAGSALLNAGRVAAATGAHAFVDPLFPRVDRGAGLPHLRRLAYFPQARGGLGPSRARLATRGRGQAHARAGT